MVWKWVQEHRERAILEQPWPAGWDAHLERNMRHFKLLADEERKQLRDLVQVFVALKTWEGCGGLKLEEEMQVTIAGQACLLVLNLPHNLYSNVESILLYPSTVRTPSRDAGLAVVSSGPVPILGEAMQGGPVLLVWDAVQKGGRHPRDGHNVVYHEFAHKLDMLDGATDGTPVFANREQHKRWVEVGTREFQALRKARDKGQRTLIDQYGTVNVGEFWAVVTECFFDLSREMKAQHPAMYEILSEFYMQDPASR